MTLIKKLSETTSIKEASMILDKLHASDSIRKLVETSIPLRASSDVNQRNHGFDFLNIAIKELDAAEEPEIPESSGLKTKDDKFVQEELLDNHNPTKSNAGSEQSSENTPPYTGEGKDAPTSDIESMQTAQGENQMKENVMPGMAPGMMSGMMPPDVNGLDPNIAQQMGNKMPQLPPFSSGQQMQQMQYTLKKYHETYVKPILETVMKQTRLIKSLQMEIKETVAKSGKFALSLPESKTRGFVRETVQSDMDVTGNVVPKVYTEYDKNNARQTIIEMNNSINESYIQ